MKTAIAFALGILVGAGGQFIAIASEKPKEEKSAAEQMCLVLVLNNIVRNCHWTK